MPEQVSVAMDEIAADMREGLLALAVGAGLQVMGQLMEADVAAVCGPRGRHDPDRTASRHGTEAGSVTLGGRRVPVSRPRVRATDGSGEVAVPAYELFNSTELLGKLAMERMLVGLSTRRYPGRAGASRGAGHRVVEIDLEVGGLAQVRAVDRACAGRSARRGPDRAGPGRVDDRRRPLRRPPVCGRARHRHRGDQAPARAGRGLHGEHHPGPRAAGRAARARPRCHPPGPGRPGRSQVAVRGGQGGLRRTGDRPVPDSQAQERPRPPAREAARPGDQADAQGVPRRF